MSVQLLGLRRRRLGPLAPAVIRRSKPQHARTRGGAYPSAKRAADLVAAVALAVAASPLLGLIAIAVRLLDGHPVIYRQQRVGRAGRIFQILKFRTMPVDAERLTGPVWSRAGDRRPTRLGGFLRRSGLDELPQIWNVLRGEMSFVGPRPERPSFVARFAEELADYPQRHAVLPGLTGWAQVSGWRGDTSLDERLRCDLEYVHRASFWFDLYIAVRTPIALWRGERR